MSSGGWPPTGSLTTSGGTSLSAWGTGSTGLSTYQPSTLERQKDESVFRSLLPVNGMVTGDQVIPVFKASALPSSKLAQIWNSVDRDGDGRINLTEFCSAMSLIRQAKQESLQQSLPSSGFASFPAPTPDPLSKTWATPAFSPQKSAPLGVGVGVSMNILTEGWGIKLSDKRRHVMEFNTLDRNKTGYLSGAEVRPILAKSELSNPILAKVWELSDIDKDGRLSCDEFVIAMHLIEKAKGGLNLPRTLPPELFPGPMKYHTVDRKASSAAKASAERKKSVPEKRLSVIDPGDWASRQMVGTEDPSLSFEDKRKENFEAGRMELDRRRRALQEQQEKIAAEKERRRREEEERRLQQELEAEQARQAELERQHRKAMEIEREREIQMHKLALQREAEQRELELKRKEEWARKRTAELESERNREKSSLQILKTQYSKLEDDFKMLDQKRLGVQASISRQRTMCDDIRKVKQTLKLSHDIRKEELKKTRGDLHSLHSRLSSLQSQHHTIQMTVQQQRPETAGYQAKRQQLNDETIGLAALLAGLRTNLDYNLKTVENLKETFKEHQTTLTELRPICHSGEVKVQQLRIMVETRKQVWQEKQRKQQEEAARRAAEERKLREERERLEREVEERAAREERLAKIKKDQDIARKKAALESVMADLSAAASPPQTPPKISTKNQSSASPGPPLPEVHRQTSAPIPAKRTSISGKKKEDAAKDKEVLKKVQELQARKVELQKQRDQQAKDASKKKGADGAGPSRPLPYAAHKLKNIIRPRSNEKLSPKPPTPGEHPLLDLVSSWDSSAQTHAGISSFKKDTSQILQPVKPNDEWVVIDKEDPYPQTSSATPPRETETSSHIEHVVVRSKGDGSGQVSVTRLSHLFESGEAFSAESAIYAVPKRITKQSLTSEGEFTSTEVQRSTSEEATPIQTVPDEVTLTSYQYKVLFDYETTDPNEVNIREGDIVTFVPNAEPQPGWTMVRLTSGEQGWAPETYLQLLEEGEGPQEAVYEEVELPVRTEEDISPPSLSAKVIYSWKGSKDNHLSIKRGESITILQQGDKWWSGEKEGQVGWFPRTFVKLEENNDEKKPETSSVVQMPLPLPPRPAMESTNQDAPSGQVYEAIYDYESEADGDLTFRAGDAIEVITAEGEWWSGVLNGVQGNFPSNYVQPRYELPSTAPAPPESQQSQPTSHHPPPTSHHTESSGLVNVLSKPLAAKVVVAFQTQHEGQLSLSPGDLIKVYKQASNGWWEGELQARGRQRVQGWFPANRVELLGHRKTSTPSLSSISSRAKSPLLEVLEDTKKTSGSENLVLAHYSYTAQSSDELSFHKGSVLVVLSKDGEWWRGELNGETGLFPSNYVQPLMEQQASSTEPTRWAHSVSSEILEAVSDQERKRQEAIFELLTSERHYNDSLKLVREVFFDPMYETNVLTEEEMGKVIVNWDELIQCSSVLLTAFLVRLRTSGAVVRNIGDVLVNQIPQLTPHVRWCSCQLNACTLLQQKSSDPQYKEFEHKCIQDSRTGGLPLSSFLLKPMQRVTKYPLLIKRILDYTPSGDLDHEDLDKALHHAETLCSSVNEGVRQKENTEHLEWLQTHVHFTLDENLIFNSHTNFLGSRKLLHWGKLFKIRGAKDVVGFLFNDFLLFVKPKLFFARAAAPTDLEPFGRNEFQMYRRPFLLESLRVKKAPVDQYGPSVFLMSHSSEEKDLPLRADSDHKRDQWLKVVTKACLEYMTTKKKMEREKMELKMRTMKGSVGLLKVTVVEGSDLLAKDPNGKSDPFCVMTLGDQQEQTTPTIHASLNPKWNYTMNFYVHDINKDVIEVSVFDKDLFSPNDFLGCAKLTLKDLFRDGDSPWTKRLLLEDVKNGEIELKIELNLNKSDLLL